MKTRDMILYSGLAIGGYFLYQKFKGVANAAADAVAKPVADMIVKLTAPPPPSVLGSMILPDGTPVPMSRVSTYWQGNNLLVNWAGQVYQLSPHDANGNYPAALADWTKIFA